MKKIILLVLIVASLGFQASNNESHEGVVSSYLVSDLNQEQMDLVADQFEVVQKKSDQSYVVYVLRNKTKELLKLAPKAMLLQENIAEDLLSTNLFSYPSYLDVLNEVKLLEQQYPEIVKVVSYGSSKQGRELFAVKISDQVHRDEPEEKKSLLLTATHGDELITVRVSLQRIRDLVGGYGSDERLTRMVNENEIYFVPVTNPDGYSIRSRYANGEDPNRSYPWPEKINRTPSKCIEDLLSFYHSKDFTGVLDIHAYGKMVMYPWAYTRDPISDSEELAQYKELGGLMTKENRYSLGQISKIIYVAKGSSADYYHWKGSVSYGIEVGRSKAPRERDVPAVLNNTREMIWQFIEGI